MISWRCTVESKWEDENWVELSQKINELIELKNFQFPESSIEGLTFEEIFQMELTSSLNLIKFLILNFLKKEGGEEKRQGP